MVMFTCELHYYNELLYNIKRHNMNSTIIIIILNKT
jgi:hypothetical protein